MTLILLLSLLSFLLGFLCGVVWNDALTLYRASRKDAE